MLSQHTVFVVPTSTINSFVRKRRYDFHRPCCIPKMTIYLSYRLHLNHTHAPSSLCIMQLRPVTCSTFGMRCLSRPRYVCAHGMHCSAGVANRVLLHRSLLCSDVRPIYSQPHFRGGISSAGYEMHIRAMDSVAPHAECIAGSGLSAGGNSSMF